MPRHLLALLLLAVSSLTAWPAAPPRSAAKEPLLPGARRRIGTARFRHGGVIRAVAFSPQGDRLASAGHDHTASVWSVPDGRELCRFSGHGADVLCIAFSPDGKEIASGGADGLVHLWRINGNRAAPIHAFTSKAESIETLAFSPNGKVLAAGGDDGALRFYDLAREKLIRQVNQDRAIRCLAWSADGQVIVTNGARHSLIVWDAETGTVLREFGTALIDCLAFAPKGRRVVTWETGGVLRLWDTETGKQIRTWGGGDESTGAEALIYQLAFSPDGGSVFCGTTSGGIDVWDPDTGKRRAQMKSHHGRVPALALAPQGKLLATGGADGVIRLWDPITHKERSKAVAPDAPIVALALDPKNPHLAVVLESGEVELWDRQTGKRLPPRFPAKAVTAAFGADGCLTLVDGKGRVVRWDPKSGKTTTQKDTGSLATGLAVAADGKSMVTTHRDGSLWLRDGKGAPRKKCIGKELRVSPGIAPDGSVVVAFGQSAQVPAWSGETGKLLIPWAGHRGGTLTAVFSADGKYLATGGRDRLAQVVDRKTGNDAISPMGHSAWVCRVAFSPDGKLFASASVEGDVHVWSAGTGRLLADIEGHRGPITGLAFADGKTLVSSGRDASVLVWDVSAASAGRAATVKLTRPRFEKFWALLLNDDPAVGSMAMQRLAGDPAAAAMLKPFLAPVDGKRIKQLLADLDADNFAKRKAAFSGLASFGRFAEGPIRADLAKKPNLEKHRRLEELLRKLTDEKLTALHLRALRSVEVLGMIGTPEARKILEALAEGAPEAELTRKAKVALAKWKK